MRLLCCGSKNNKKMFLAGLTQINDCPGGAGENTDVIQRYLESKFVVLSITGSFLVKREIIFILVIGDWI